MINYAPAQLLPLAQRTGRWTIKQVHGHSCLYTTNLASSIRFLVTNSPAVLVNVLNNGQPGFPSQMYAWRVDNGPWHRVPASQRTLKISLLDTERHLIEVTCAGNTDFDQVWQGQQGFAITGIMVAGQITPAPQRPLVNFIGDSITAGCWVNGKQAALDYRPESNYVGLASDQANIDGVRIAYSAAGVLRPGTGGVPVAKGFLPAIDADTKWTVNDPQLTIVNLGVNDRRFPAARFKLAYEDFLKQVITTFPTSRIALLVPFSQTFRNEITATAAKYAVPLVQTAGWCTDYTDNLHPNQRGAQTAGDHFAKTLRQLLS
ncbi:GDSL-type esterase/lipase family protein [Limosilactobacillus sp.]|uniref:GDSL-type esterase/lipase family protein n=1 Tax=Limosilactobacillus sp. TaxID=2773925 RepID=UPI003F732792